MANEAVSDFALAAAGGREFRLSALDSKLLVLYFYPKDKTPGSASESGRSSFVVDTVRATRREWRAVKVPGHAREVPDFVETV